MLFFFFFNDTATTEIYTLSLHDALPIYGARDGPPPDRRPGWQPGAPAATRREAGRTRSSQQHQSDPMSQLDRKSTRLNSSHSQISYAVFCLKKKKQRHLPRHSQTALRVS